MDAIPEAKIGKYEILRVLGRGGMGEVLLAQDLDLNRKVAIKRPFKSALEDGLARFQVEARAATLNHRNIPAVYELGVQDGLPFIAMEYVEGRSLDQIISSHLTLDLITKLSIIEQVCSALGYAHLKGIIHRDIKPANVIVQPDGVVKIIDFGIAKMQSADGAMGLTQNSLIIGSLHYIAPERFKGETIDGRADIFSTGVMLYLLLTGSLPFPGAEATAAYKIVNERHIALSTHMHDYPASLDSILDRALAKSPAQRYATAEDFADALHEVIEDLKRNRVGQLYGDAERLSTERKFEPALELLNEAINLDPANTQVRRLRKFVREQQDKIKREENLHGCLERAEEALAAEGLDDALRLLKEAIDCDPDYPGLKERLQLVEEKKRRLDRITTALANAEALRGRDTTGAIRLLERALSEDPGNPALLSAREALARQAESEAQAAKLRDIFDGARRKLAAKDFGAVREALDAARAIDPAHPEIDRVLAEMTRFREQEDRRRVLDEIQRRVHESMQAGSFTQAHEMISRALEKLPTEAALLRLKAEVEGHTRGIEARRLADQAINTARQLSASDPSRALTVVQEALTQMPGEERLIEYEKVLRQQAGSMQAEQQLHRTLQSAREMVDRGQFDTAASILEAFQSRNGSRPETEEFLSFVRDQSAEEHRRHENTQRQAVQDTLAAARQLAQKNDFEAAFELLRNAAESLGQSDDLARANDEVTKARIAYAQTAVGRSIAAAQSALAAKDGKLALEALSAAAAFVSFSDQRRQADWHSASDAAHQLLAARTATPPPPPPPPLLGTDITPPPDLISTPVLVTPPPDDGWSTVTATGATTPITPLTKSQTSGASPSQPSGKSSSGSLLAVLAAVVVLLIGGGAFAWWKLRPSPAAHSYLNITHAPAGATVSIDHGSLQSVDPSGELKTEIQPGERSIEIQKAGYEPFQETVQVRLGETLNYSSISLTKREPPKAPDLPRQNEANEQAPAKLSVQTTPKAHILIDGQVKAIADQAGNFTTTALSPGTHTIDIYLDGFKSAKGKAIVLTAGGEATLTQSLSPSAFNPSHETPKEINTGDAEVEKIRNAHDRFEAAYGSKNIEQLKSEWLDIGKQRSDQMQDIFQKADVVAIHEKCNGVPTITGNDANWRCTEIVQLNKNFFGPNPKTLHFSKIGPKWVLRDK